jgi:hypothetical protein
MTPPKKDIMMDDELRVIKEFTAYIDLRLAQGATQAELDKLYEDLHSLQENYYLGELLGDI